MPVVHGQVKFKVNFKPWMTSYMQLVSMFCKPVSSIPTCSLFLCFVFQWAPSLHHFLFKSFVICRHSCTGKVCMINNRVLLISPPYTALTHTWQVLELGFVITWISLYCLRQFMNIIEPSKRMASYQRTVKTLSYKPDGNVFVWVGANKMEGGLINGTLRYMWSCCLIQ